MSRRLKELRRFTEVDPIPYVLGVVRKSKELTVVVDDEDLVLLQMQDPVLPEVGQNDVRKLLPVGGHA
jgi:hypothetical protein